MYDWNLWRFEDKFDTMSSEMILVIIKNYPKIITRNIMFIIVKRNFINVMQLILDQGTNINKVICNDNSTLLILAVNLESKPPVYGECKYFNPVLLVRQYVNMWALRNHKLKPY